MLEALIANGKFELLAFTSGNKEYMEAIVGLIQKQKRYFNHCLSREKCLRTGPETLSEDPTINMILQKVPFKDLNQLLVGGRRLEDIILVDNRELGCVLQPENLIPIHDYMGSF